MGEYWGATADPNYGYSPYSGQLKYGSYPPSQVPFAPPPALRELAPTKAGRPEQQPPQFRE